MELADQLLEVLRGQLGVLRDAPLLLEARHLVLHLRPHAVPFARLDPLRLLHHHVGVHHHQAPVGVEDEARVARAGNEPLARLRGQPDVQDRLHHAGHRAARTGAHGDEQGPLHVAEGGADHAAHSLEGRADLGVEPLGDPPPDLQVLVADLGGDGEAGGDGDAEVRHLGEVRPLAAEQGLHGRAAVRTAGAEEIHTLRSAHVRVPSKVSWKGHFSWSSCFCSSSREMEICLRSATSSIISAVRRTRSSRSRRMAGSGCMTRT